MVEKGRNRSLDGISKKTERHNTAQLSSVFRRGALQGSRNLQGSRANIRHSLLSQQPSLAAYA